MLAGCPAFNGHSGPVIGASSQSVSTRFIVTGNLARPLAVKRVYGGDHADFST